MSVLLHGVTAWPLSIMYGRWVSGMDHDDDAGEMQDAADIATRNRVTPASGS